MNERPLPLGRLEWHEVHLSGAFSEAEVTAALRFCAPRTHLLKTEGGIDSVRILCADRDEAAAAAEVIRAAVVDARKRLEIQDRDGRMLDGLVASLIKQAVGT